MKFWWLPVLTTVAIAGCSNTQVVSSAVDVNQQVVTSAEKVQWSKSELPVDISVDITKESQLLINNFSNGPIFGLEVDGNRGSLDIAVESLVVSEKTLYAQSVLVTDDMGNTLVDKPFSDADYKQAGAMDPDKFVVSFNVIPKINTEKLHILVYTTKDDSQAVSTVKHPAKIFAEAKGTVPPIIPDPEVKHDLYGQLRISVTSNDLVTKRAVKEQEYVPNAATSQDYYISGIQKAVAEDNIPKALSLLDEAKELNIEGAQEAFIKAINAK
ncbi:maltose operon periplasmic protein MalM [Vibrio maritimus]|uniref:Maltose operon periplasmic protein MalM n=1 Tax=Vibrio maritimus TaxID=990268 RepID=A0A090RML2_9VIBR|nr:maltose operon periplasmic protein MalM [Vibrio maritimus]